jgi:hypothetical protein
MEQAIEDLVRMGDIDSLYEVMTENEDFMYSLDAAEGLIILGDKRGIEYLLDATQSDDEDISGVAREILDSPEVRRKREELDVDQKKERQAALENVKKRIAEGRKVFIYKTVFLPSSYFISAVPSEDGDSVEALNDFGFDGWEVAAFLGSPGGPRASVTMSGRPTGGYFLIKKEVSANESAELDAL